MLSLFRVFITFKISWMDCCLYTRISRKDEGTLPNCRLCCFHAIPKSQEFECLQSSSGFCHLLFLHHSAFEFEQLRPEFLESIVVSNTEMHCYASDHAAVAWASPSGSFYPTTSSTTNFSSNRTYLSLRGNLVIWDWLDFYEAVVFLWNFGLEKRVPPWDI